MNAMLQPVEPRIPVGIHPDLPASEYYVRRLDEAHNSGLTIIDEKSPAHYYHHVMHPEDDEESEALAFGTAFHTAVLEPEKFHDLYVLPPVGMPKDLRCHRNAKDPSVATLKSIEAWDEYDARCVGKLQITRKDYDTVLAMRDSFRAYEMEIPLGGGRSLTFSGADLLDACEKEVTVCYVDEETGIVCLTRADLWLPDAAFGGDLKSTHNGAKEAFSQSVTRFRYHVQSSHYAEAFRVCGSPLRSFGLFPVEKKRPHVAASWHVDSISEERGWAIRQRSMRKLDTCLKSGKWPGHTTTVAPISIKPYGHYDSED